LLQAALAALDDAPLKAALVELLVGTLEGAS
jgi:hypothetical protein